MNLNVKISKVLSVAGGNVKQYNHSGKQLVGFLMKTKHILIRQPSNHTWAFPQR